MVLKKTSEKIAEPLSGHLTASESRYDFPGVDHEGRQNFSVIKMQYWYCLNKLLKLSIKQTVEVPVQCLLNHFRLQGIQ